MPQNPEALRLNHRSVWVTERRVATRRKDGRRGTKKRAVVRWIEDGKIREKGFPDPLRAGRFAAEKREELAGVRAVPPTDDLLLSEWRDAYLSGRYAEYREWLAGQKPRLRDKYLRVLLTACGRFLDRAGDRPLGDYGPLDFVRFRSTLSAETDLSPVTIENYLIQIRVFFRAAEREGLLVRAPEIRARNIHYEKPVFEPEDIEEIFEAAKKWPKLRPCDEKRYGKTTGRLYPILATLYYTMMRRGELIHLTWADVVTAPDGGREILVRPKEWTEEEDGKRVRHRWEPKDREIRAIPLHPALDAILRGLRRRKANRLWVFTNHRGERWTVSGIASLVNRFENATGLKVGFHSWRRSGLTHLHDAGVPPGQIQAIAGHSSLDTTMRYVRPSAKGRRKAILALKAM